MLHINSLRKFHTYDDNDNRPVMTAVVEEWDGDGNFNWFDYRQITDDDPALRQSGAAENVARELHGVRVNNAETGSGQACDAHDEEPTACRDDDVSASGETQWAMGRNLTEEQHRQLTELLDEFADVFDAIPGKTDLITHKIHVTDDTPIWYTDGSSVAISAVLMQTGENDEDEYVVAYASKKLTPAEKKYAIIEIELLAILFGVIIINTSMAQQWKYGQITDLSFG